MRESDLYVPVRDHLIANGHEVHVEIFDADIVTMCDGKLWAIELKPCLTQGLIWQLNHRAQWADYCVAAIGTKPRSTDELRGYGHGLWQVVDGRVRQRVKPRPQPWFWHKRRDYRIKRLSNRAPAMEHERAGLPAGRGLREQRNLRKLEAEDAH